MSIKNLYIHFAFTFFVSAYTTTYSQKLPDKLKTYFNSPVKHPIVLSGNFGELRSTHFHSGIDIKPSSENAIDAIYSAADGYVYRIKVQTGGFGRAIYIHHPEIGYSTVYAHMDSFEDALQQYTFNIQKSRESYSVDFNIPKSVFPVKKGQKIGTMGNTGQSYGTHLHFEIREIASEKPVNPFIFGIKPPDRKPPVLMNVSVHAIDKDFQKKAEKTINILSIYDNVRDVNQSVGISSSTAGIAVEAFDRMDGAPNKNGIYKLNLYVDDSIHYSYVLDKISFGETHQISGFLDYGRKKIDSSNYVLCYKLPGLTLGFLRHNKTGLINLLPDRSRKICVEVEDFENNITDFLFYVHSDSNMVVTPEPGYIKKINLGEAVVAEVSNCRVKFPQNALYRNIFFNMEAQKVDSGNTQYSIHQDTEPLKSNIEISLKPDALNDKFRNKAIILKTERDGKKTNYGGDWQADRLITVSRSFGLFHIDYDTIAPTIKPISFTKKLSDKEKFVFEIKDDLETAGKAREIRYKVWINGKTVICPYKPLTHTLEIPLRYVSAGKHQLRIEVKDYSGNTANFNSSFNR